MDAQSITDYLKNTGPVSIITFILGFFVSRWTMTKKKERIMSKYYTRMVTI
jgi:hypothetical protein